MKKILATILVLVFSLTLTACNKEENDINNQHNELITKSIEELEKVLKEEHNKSNYSNSDGYFEIKNTRIIEIKDNDVEIFKDMDYIVEFLSFDDFYGSAPYYRYTGMYESVAVYKSGKIEPQQTNPFRIYSTQTYTYDFSNIIKSITDYNNKYNCVKYLK